MARRTSPHDPSIGERIRTRRQVLGYSVRFAASRAGLSHTSWGRIERGEQSADNRFTLADIAEALRCSVTDLIGQPAHADGARTVEVAAAETVRAIVEADLDYQPMRAAATAIKPIGELIDDVELARSLWRRGDYRGAGLLVAPTVRGLHAVAYQPADDEQRRAALRGIVLSCETGMSVVRYGAGQATTSALLAERGRQAAALLGEPVTTALSDWNLTHAALGCGLYERGVGIARAAIDRLYPHADNDGGMEMLGTLHLIAAFALYGDGRLDDAIDLLAEADRIAERTGDTMTLGLMFGPTNTRFWRVAMEVDGGDPGKAVEIARDTNPLLLNVPMRQVSFYLDTARALARIGRDREAVRMLVAAERLGPQRLRADALVAETLRCLLERAQRDAAGAELRGLCERLGVLV